jgi:hypothetical protein
VKGGADVRRNERPPRRIALCPGARRLLLGGAVRLEGLAPEARSDLLELGKEIVASIVDAPEVEGTARAVASIADRESPLAEASRRFWNIRFELAGEIVERAIARGEIPPDTDPGVVLEAVIAPIYFRLLMTGEKLDGEFLERLTELLAAGASARSWRPPPAPPRSVPSAPAARSDPRSPTS